MNDYKGRYCSIDGESEDVEMPHTDGFYQYENSKSKYPAYHFRLSARDLALYGQLYLNKGEWNGRQIVPEKWIEKVLYHILYTTLIMASLMECFPVCSGHHTVIASEISYYHTGLGIHMLGIYPDSKLVLVHRVDTENEFDYSKGDLNRMIGMVFDSRLPDRK